MNRQQIKAAWNEQADAPNQWDNLGEDEKVEWAFTLGTARVAELEKDAARLDLLESRRYAVTDSQTYHNPHGEHVANGWLLESPHITLREAIDSELLAKEEGCSHINT